MGLFFNNTEKRSISLSDIWGTAIDTTEKGAINEATYFGCIDYISSSIAKLQLEILDTSTGSKLPYREHKLWNKLALRPNKSMTAFQCIKTFIQIGLHYGISGLYIDRNDNCIYPVKINYEIIDDAGLINSTFKNPILYNCTLDTYNFDTLESNIVVFRYGYTRDGLHVEAVKDILSSTVNSLIKSQDYLNQTFKDGLVGKCVVQTTSTIEDKKELAKVQNKFQSLYSNNGRIFTVPAGFNVSNLNMKLADAEFSAIRSLTKKEICSAFRLPSTVVNDYGDLNYNMSESIYLKIFSDCLQPIMVQIQQDMTYKYLSETDLTHLVIEFNEDDFYRLDMKTRVEVTERLMNKGIITINDGRKDFNYPPLDIPGANIPIIQSGFMPVDVAMTYYSKDNNAKGGENSGDKGD